jgi:molybdate transport system substrate-binding protein
MVLLLAGCGGQTPAPAPLSVAAASDLRFALEEVVAVFERHSPGADVEVTYGSSGNFYAQLLNGAPFDIFLSADVAYPRQLSERGLTLPGSEFSYADGRIVVWVPSGSRVPVETVGLDALVDPAVAHVAIANPQHAPYGRAAEAAMRGARVYDRVKPRLVLGENISQTLQFVQSGAADAGIVALSLALAPPVAGTGRYWLVPEGMHPRIEQGGAILKSTPRADAARALRAMMLGDEGRAVLKRYGFTVPGD